MDSSDHPEHRRRRFARIRRAKWLLRFAPRKARFHHYPLIGRFADVARKRAYLWSFRIEHVRPSLYAGSIVSLLPIMGVQAPVAFLLALLLRSNVMILIGLQFITNPFTAVPLYYGTHQLGQAVIEASGFGASAEIVKTDDPIAASPEAPAAPPVAPTPSDQPSPPPRPTQSTELAPTPHHELAWTQRLGTTVNALVLGGIIAGSVLGLVLDIAWRFGITRAAAHKAKVAERKRRSDSTPPSPSAE